MENGTIGFNGSAKEVYEGEGTPDEVNRLGRFALESVDESGYDHPEHNDQATADQIVEQRKNRAKTAIKIAAGVGAAAMTVALIVHGRGRYLPPFNHD